MGKTYFKTLIFSLIAQCLYHTAYTQTVINIDSDSRFTGKIKGEYYDDPTGMLQDFTLGMEWWKLLGEPIENYGIMWNTSGSFKTEIEGKPYTLSRTSLEKYPDLQKRFDYMTPSIDVVIYGTANGKTVSVRRGTVFAHSSFYGKGSAYKKDGKSYDPYTLQAPFLYEIKDVNFLVGKSGKMSYSLSPGSPKSWNYFLSWKQRTSNYMAPNTTFDYLVLNKSDYDYSKLSTAAREDLDGKLNYLYSQTSSFTIKAQITNLKWPEYEMKSIIKEYLKRENGGEWQVSKTPDISNDWGELPEDKEPETKKIYIFTVIETTIKINSNYYENKHWISPIV